MSQSRPRIEINGPFYCLLANDELMFMIGLIPELDPPRVKSIARKFLEKRFLSDIDGFPEEEWTLIVYSSEMFESINLFTPDFPNKIDPLWSGAIQDFNLFHKS